MKKIYERQDIEDKILQLINLIESDLNCSLLIDRYIEDKLPREKNDFINQPEGMFLIRTSNNCFFEAVSNTKSLLIPVGNEVSFALWSKYNIKQDIIDQIKEFKKEFQKEHFEKMRQAIIDHKQLENIGDPINFAIITIQIKVIEKLQKIVRELKEKILKDNWFISPFYNNPLDDAEKGLKMLLNSL